MPAAAHAFAGRAKTPEQLQQPRSFSPWQASVSVTTAKPPHVLANSVSEPCRGGIPRPAGGNATCSSANQWCVPNRFTADPVRVSSPSLLAKQRVGAPHANMGSGTANACSSAATICVPPTNFGGEAATQAHCSFSAHPSRLQHDRNDARSCSPWQNAPNLHCPMPSVLFPFSFQAAASQSVSAAAASSLKKAIGQGDVASSLRPPLVKKNEMAVSKIGGMSASLDPSSCHGGPVKTSLARMGFFLNATDGCDASLSSVSPLGRRGALPNRRSLSPPPPGGATFVESTGKRPSVSLIDGHRSSSLGTAHHAPAVPRGRPVLHIPSLYHTTSGCSLPPHETVGASVVKQTSASPFLSGSTHLSCSPNLVTPENDRRTPSITRPVLGELASTGSAIVSPPEQEHSESIGGCTFSPTPTQESQPFGFRFTPPPLEEEPHQQNWSFALSDQQCSSDSSRSTHSILGNCPVGGDLIPPVVIANAQSKIKPQQQIGRHYSSEGVDFRGNSVNAQTSVGPCEMYYSEPVSQNAGDVWTEIARRLEASSNQHDCAEGLKEVREQTLGERFVAFRQSLSTQRVQIRPPPLPLRELAMLAEAEQEENYGHVVSSDAAVMTPTTTATRSSTTDDLQHQRTDWGQADSGPCPVPSSWQPKPPSRQLSHPQSLPHRCMAERWVTVLPPRAEGSGVAADGVARRTIASTIGERKHPPGTNGTRAGELAGDVVEPRRRPQDRPPAPPVSPATSCPGGFGNKEEASSDVAGEVARSWAPIIMGNATAEVLRRLSEEERATSAQQHEKKCKEVDADEPRQAFKTPPQRERIRTAVRESLTFTSLPERCLEQIVDAFRDEVFRQDDVIDVEGGLYILERGSLDVLALSPEGLTGELLCTCDQPGQALGDLAIFHPGGPCSSAATVVASPDAVLWVVGRDEFRRCVRRARYGELLASVPVLQNLSKSLRAELADSLWPRTYRAGDLIVRRGDRRDEFFIVETGKAVALFPSNDDQSDGDGVFGDSRCRNHNYGRVVQTYGRGNFFGEPVVFQSGREQDIAAPFDIVASHARGAVGGDAAAHALCDDNGVRSVVDTSALVPTTTTVAVMSGEAYRRLIGDILVRHE
eukprot:TRINITY_DN34417_c0_g1_i1.p1 TRINITY_DN34417_c0_g1~~TRINITY_DN34417_c0_g1_i1.p1  ORF type:complete len:1291 (+),score=148.74 TRINITY_DN34417_c0_g1_i1:558-3875(+)